MAVLANCGFCLDFKCFDVLIQTGVVLYSIICRAISHSWRLFIMAVVVYTVISQNCHKFTVTATGISRVDFLSLFSVRLKVKSFSGYKCYHDR